MIEVNLLPNELRKVEKTPLPIFLALIGCVVIGLAAISGYIYFQFGILRAKTVELKEAELLSTQVKELTVRKDALIAEISAYKKRLERLLVVKENKVLWAEKIFLLASHLKRNETGIWFESMNMKQADLFVERNDMLKKYMVKKAAAEKDAKKKKDLKPEEKQLAAGTFKVACRQKDSPEYTLDKIQDFQDWLRMDRLFIISFTDNINIPSMDTKIETLAVPEDQKTRVFEMTLTLKPVKLVVEDK